MAQKSLAIQLKHIIFNGTVDASIDWNNIQDGIYIVAIQGGVKEGSNGPVGIYGYGTLRAYYNSQTGNVAQVYYSHQGHLAYRERYGTTTAWSAWIQPYSIKNKPTPEDIGAALVATYDDASNVIGF